MVLNMYRITNGFKHAHHALLNNLWLFTIDASHIFSSYKKGKKFWEHNLSEYVSVTLILNFC